MSNGWFTRSSVEISNCGTKLWLWEKKLNLCYFAGEFSFHRIFNFSSKSSDAFNADWIMREFSDYRCNK